MRTLSGGLLMGGDAVVGFTRGCLFIDALEHLGQGGFIHGENPFRANSLQEAGDGWIVEYEPIIFGCDVDIAEADLLGWELEFGAAVRSFALLDQALFM